MGETRVSLFVPRTGEFVEPGVVHAVKGGGMVDADSGVSVVGLKFEFRERGWLGWTCIIPGRVMRLMLGFVMMLFRNCGKEGCRIAVAISRRVEG